MAIGSLKAVNQISFALHKGELIGLLDPNGACKTTIIRLILNLLKPESRQINVFGGAMDEAKKSASVIYQRNMAFTKTSGWNASWRI
jgi:ABC-2 type transport system ATP-binding protein